MAITGSATIKVDTQVLKTQSSEASKSISKMEESFSELESVINGTLSYWIGEAGDKHRKIYKDQSENITEMFNRLKEHPRDLLEIAGVYENVESAVDEIANSLPEDVIV